MGEKIKAKPSTAFPPTKKEGCREMAAFLRPKYPDARILIDGSSVCS
jgi:hypothetical protein